MALGAPVEQRLSLPSCGSVILAALIVAAIAAVGSLGEVLFSNEKGAIKSDDCRINVVVNKSSFYAMTHKFVCQSTYYSGVGTEVLCHHIETENGLCISDRFYDDSPPAESKEKTP